MKTEVKKVDGTTRQIDIEASGDIVKNKFDEVFARLAKEAKVRGFRPGHAPRDIIEKEFSSDAHQMVLKELIPDIYSEAVKKENLEVIDLPEIFDVKLDRALLSFKAKVEVAPEIKLASYKGVKVHYKKIEVALDDVKRSIDSLKETRKADSIDDAFAKGLGYPSLAELEKAVERQIFLQKENAQRQKIENEVIEAVTKDIDFKIPESLVNRQLQDMLKQAKVDLALKGLPREKIDEQEKTLVKELEPEAKKQVKLYLIFNEIAKKENIPQDEHMSHRVIEFLLRQADWKESSM